jgi:hypothetical protein
MNVAADEFRSSNPVIIVDFLKPAALAVAEFENEDIRYL